jgi:hypothetical protein
MDAKREQFVRRDMQTLTSALQKRFPKWRRNFNRYANNGRRSEDIREQYGNALSYHDTNAGEDTGTVPNINVIRSAIDTHVSKLSEVKVRPFFNPIVGTFKTRKVCRNAQIYFDEFFEDQDVYRKAIQTVRYADVFEVGHLWVDDEDRRIKRLAPWEYYFDAAEFHYGHISRCFIIQKQFPLIALKARLEEWNGAHDNSEDALVQRLDLDPAAKVERAIYFDLLEGKKYTFADTRLIGEDDIEYTIPPVATLYREEPLKGAFSVAMADDLYTVQAQIDSLCERIHLALELSPANTIWVPEGSEVKASALSSEIGAVYKYRPVPGAEAGVFVSTPQPIDPSYIKFLEFWIRTGYEMLGISQLSAQAKKPSGINSGVALQTVEDVESERHNPILQSFIRLLMEVAKIAIEVFPKGEDVLPRRRSRAQIKWADIKREHESFSIQFSASSSLSKDPKVKMEQVEKLINMQIINPAMASSILEFPDLEGAYSITSSSYDYCQKIIERAVEKGEFDFYEVVNIQQLFGEAVNTLLRLDANEEDPEVLDRLVNLIVIVKGKLDTVNQTMAPPMPPEPVPGPMPPPPEAMAPPPAPPAAPPPVEPPPPPVPTPPIPIEVHVITHPQPPLPPEPAAPAKKKTTQLVRDEAGQIVKTITTEEAAPPRQTVTQLVRDETGQIVETVQTQEPEVPLG